MAASETLVGHVNEGEEMGGPSHPPCPSINSAAMFGNGRSDHIIVQLNPNK